MNEIVQKSFDLAISRHKGQLYGINLPYSFHIYETYNIATEYTNDKHVLSATILHDIIEDTSTTYEELYDGFGEYITNLVFYVSDPIGLNRRERKDLLYYKFQNLLNDNNFSDEFKRQVALIKCCDRYVNMLQSYAVSDFNKMDMYMREYSEFKFNFINELSSEHLSLYNRLKNLASNVNERLNSNSEVRF